MEVDQNENDFPKTVCWFIQRNTYFCTEIKRTLGSYSKLKIIISKDESYWTFRNVFDIERKTHTDNENLKNMEYEIFMCYTERKSPEEWRLREGR